MTFSFEDKVVAVTGAARGLGRVTALGFARTGAKVVISDIDDAGGEETLRQLQGKGGEGLYLHTDVRSEAQVQEMIDKAVHRYGRLDCAVNNAGTEIVGYLVDQTAEHFDTLIDTNIKGVFYCLKHELRQMLAQGGGAIVNQASITSSLTGIPQNGLYAATKGAVIALAKTAARGPRSHKRQYQRKRRCGLRD